MPQFRKKPIEVIAVQWDGNLGTLAELDPHQSHVEVEVKTGDLLIQTLEGIMHAKPNKRARPGDWIVRGIVGELHPVRDDIFRQTNDAI